jgi:NAD(P) transhydrogenase
MPGRRAVRHAVGHDLASKADVIPIGVYTIPEIATVGITELSARDAHGDILVGIAKFEELARAQIAGTPHGFLKLISNLDGYIIGDGATELIHMGQVALLSGWRIDSFIDNIFNFPTFAEAYRVAALDIAGQRAQVSVPV